MASGGASPCTLPSVVAGGNRIPGIAQQSFYASFGYEPEQGWRGGVELRALGNILANDANTARVAGYALASLFVGYLQHWEHWDFSAFARIDNALDHHYIGSVIVNEGNARYFEPAPGGAPGWWAAARPTGSEVREGWRAPSFAACVPCSGRGVGELLRSALQARRCTQLCRGLGRFPGELGLFAAEVPVGGGLLVDRAQQVEHLDDALRTQVEMFANQCRDRLVEITPVPSV